MCVIIAALSVPWTAAAEDDDDDERAGSDTVVEIVDGRTRLHIDPAALDRFGIELKAPQSLRVEPQQHVLGEVLDAASVAELEQALARAAADRNAAAAALKAQRALLAQFDRMREKGLAVDTVALGRERRQLPRYLADERNAGIALQAARARARQTWGATLGDRLAAGGDPLVRDLATANVFLVAVPVPGTHLAGGPVYVGRGETRDDATAATWLGPAPRSRHPLSATLLAAVPDPDLRPGMRVTVWLEPDGAGASGWRVPRRALVWHAGERWIYIELEAGLLERRHASVLSTEARDVVVAADDTTPLRVAVVGAPSLLGEELRWSIPDEDDD